jgi:hypothetical protein
MRWSSVVVVVTLKIECLPVAHLLHAAQYLLRDDEALNL